MKDCCIISSVDANVILNGNVYLVLSNSFFFVGAWREDCEPA